MGGDEEERRRKGEDVRRRGGDVEGSFFRFFSSKTSKMQKEKSEGVCFVSKRWRVPRLIVRVCGPLPAIPPTSSCTSLVLIVFLWKIIPLLLWSTRNFVSTMSARKMLSSSLIFDETRYYDYINLIFMFRRRYCEMLSLCHTL